MEIIFFIFGMQKDGFGGFEKGHFCKKPCGGRGLELAKSKFRLKFRNLQTVNGSNQ